MFQMDLVHACVCVKAKKQDNIPTSKNCNIIYNTPPSEAVKNS